MNDYKNFAIDFIKQAGEIMLKHFAIGVPKTNKPGLGPVTKADLEINNLLIREVKKYFPDHGVLGEEESNFKEGGNEYTWVCDPIDGTIVFARGIPIATSALALTRNGESILGVVYDPFCKRLFVGEKGKGATLNDKPIHVSAIDQLKGAEGVLEISATSKYNILDLPKLLKSREGANVGVFNAFIYMAMLGAAGQFDFGVFPRTGAHDVAAVKIIIEEAGGKVTDLFGNEQRYDRPTKGILASNGKIHDQLLKILKEVMQTSS